MNYYRVMHYGKHGDYEYVIFVSEEIEKSKEKAVLEEIMRNRDNDKEIHRIYGPYKVIDKEIMTIREPE